MVYKYDFFNFDNKLDFSDSLEVIEISSSLSENRKLKLKKDDYEFSVLEIEENDKRYRLCFGNMYEKADDNECEIDLLENLENIIERTKSLEVLNLENVLKIVKDYDEISYISIYKEEHQLASIDFINGDIRKYEINEPNRSVVVSFDNHITRNTERNIDGVTVKNKTEITSENYEKIKSDYKLLFKKL